MRLPSFLRPRPILSEEEVARGLRVLTWEGATALGFFSITTSGLLAAFALALGASNTQIGLLAAIPFVTQLLQIPAIPLVEKLRARKAISILTWFPAQLLWIPIALLPFLSLSWGVSAVVLLLFLQLARGVFAAVTNCSWNSWMRDLIPQGVLGNFFSRRLSFGTAAAVIFGLGGALFVDVWIDRMPSEYAIYGYAIVIFVGAITLALASPVLMLWVPEPAAQRGVATPPSLWRTIATPFRDSNYRILIQFLFWWGFASNLAIPFFTVYMLQRLGLPLTWVMGLTVMSQVFNVLFIRVWGRLTDQFGSKPVLYVNAALYLLVILGWTFTTMPERYPLTLPLLVVLHIFAGVAASGVTLTVSTIGLKLAPRGEGTSYLAASSLATNVGAGLGPLMGGVFADYFSVRTLSFTFSWMDPSRSLSFPTFSLMGFDFLFALAFLGGLLTLNILRAVREEGEVDQQVLLDELLARSGGVTRAVSSVPGLRFLAEFPFAYLRRVPGMNVALGVTAYQVASMTEAATVTALRTRDVMFNVVDGVSETVERLAANVEDISEISVDLARQAARGTLHALDELTVNVGYLTRQAILGVVKGAGNWRPSGDLALSGAVHGAVQGAQETDANMVEVVVGAIETAREVAPTLGLEEEEAVKVAATAALNAGQEMGAEAEEKVRAIVEQELGAEALAAIDAEREAGGSPMNQEEREEQAVA